MLWCAAAGLGAGAKQPALCGGTRYALRLAFTRRPKSPEISVVSGLIASLNYHVKPLFCSGTVGLNDDGDDGTGAAASPPECATANPCRHLHWRVSMVVVRHLNIHALVPPKRRKLFFGC
ncbi:hypothetical protein E2C01_076031 [Portunus trituberculatus]|uniref:Uncharacterized protein n=1 Tax=Portunus trituberculatus TaxID=210409 RepID=A0A5B7IHA6_PORTR|nr:hypothetical protein [Portunus trituberculatus]